MKSIYFFQIEKNMIQIGQEKHLNLLQ